MISNYDIEFVLLIAKDHGLEFTSEQAEQVHDFCSQGREKDYFHILHQVLIDCRDD